MGSQEEERLLLEEGIHQDDSNRLYTGDGSVDIKGNPVLKSNTGNWRACPFILGTECCERLAYYGIATNLVSYLTKELHEGNVSAARDVTTWQGTCYLAPLIGAILADTIWGRYWTIAVFSTIYFIGMCTLTLSASVPVFMPAECVDGICPPATPAQYVVLFFGLYLIALGTGGIKPCVSSFGADQFDDTDENESIKKGSFFNWFYFSINIGALVSSSLIVWIQDNAGWGLGFGIPALFMGIAIVSFFAGTSLYRFQKPGGSPITRMCQVLVASFRKWNLAVPNNSGLLFETQDKMSAIKGSRKLGHTDELKCLDKAAVISNDENKTGDYSNPWRLCTVTQVEELKILIRMFPIWATGIVFSAVYAQMSTMFVEQNKRWSPASKRFTNIFSMASAPLQSSFSSLISSFSDRWLLQQPLHIRPTSSNRRCLRVFAAETTSGKQKTPPGADTRIHWENEDEGWIGGNFSKTGQKLEPEEKKQDLLGENFSELLNNSTDSHYQFLGVSVEADIEEIKSAYRRLSKEYHPDTTSLPLKAASEKFMKLRDIYDTLCDEEKRRFYDWTLAQEAASREAEKMRIKLEDPYMQQLRNFESVPDMVDRLGGRNMELSGQAKSALTFDIVIIIFSICCIVYVIVFKEPYY